MKKVALSIVAAKYVDLITVPDDFHGGQDDGCRIIQRNLKAVLDDSSFHFGPPDENVCHISYYVP